MMWMREWISVAETLPEKGQRVLVVNKQGMQRITQHNGHHFDCPEIVTHWSFLPPPPEPEQKVNY